ncbi:MAG: hypothetical protein HYV47_00400 [Candidatus Nealsonbacteria bacterium]|nr:hypothetical protein [Candidatus Nealsonbacteria bacterium]
MAEKIITQVGSLPYKNVKQAVKYSLKHDIPFLPELPLLGDAILEYIKNPGQLSCLEEFKEHSFDVVKVQCVGPSTLVMSGYEAEDAVERAYNHISCILDGLEAKEIILFLDEPALGQAGFDFEELWLPIFSSFKVTPGVHCCGNMDWDKLFKSDLVKIISFDASQFDITKYPHYRNGKRIAWGAKESINVKNFQPGDLLTLPCGMGTKLYSVKDCQKELERLKEIVRQLN